MRVGGNFFKVSFGVKIGLISGSNGLAPYFRYAFKQIFKNEWGKIRSFKEVSRLGV